jgi:leucyl-tRNA synthetase
MPGSRDGAGDARRAALRRKVHRTIARVTDDIERRLHLNTPVSSLMELLNEMQEFVRDETPADAPYLAEAGRAMALLLQPMAPHISEEIWALLGGRGLALQQPWPEADPAWLVEDLVEIPVQVSGRLRGHVRVAPDAPEGDVVALARAHQRIATHLAGKTVRKVVYLPGRLLNIVAV